MQKKKPFQSKFHALYPQNQHFFNPKITNNVQPQSSAITYNHLINLKQSTSFTSPLNLQPTRYFFELDTFFTPNLFLHLEIQSLTLFQKISQTRIQKPTLIRAGTNALAGGHFSFSSHAIFSALFS
jgi:hypothetical protein